MALSHWLGVFPVFADEEQALDSMWSSLDEGSAASVQAVLQPRGVGIETVSRLVEDANRTMQGNGRVGSWGRHSRQLSLSSWRYVTWCCGGCVDPPAAEGAFDFAAREADASAWAWEECRMVAEVSFLVVAFHHCRTHIDSKSKCTLN
jgi:hypothetical protein